MSNKIKMLLREYYLYALPVLFSINLKLIFILIQVEFLQQLNLKYCKIPNHFINVYTIYMRIKIIQINIIKS